MNRRESIKYIVDEFVEDDTVVVSSPGLISRELFNYKDRTLNFYVQGSMGATLGISIGIAMNTDKYVYAICGDGDVLMSLDTLVLANSLKLQNLCLFILDNNSYSSTGGQRTISDFVQFDKIFNCNVLKISKDNETPKDVPRISIPHEKITERFRKAMS
jgi:thiamine pyrophosphate-dependent acetolactate synthase large subunit-like protein